MNRTLQVLFFGITLIPIPAARADVVSDLIAHGMSIRHQVQPGKSIHLYHWTTNSKAFSGRPDAAAPVVSPNDGRVRDYSNYLRGQFEAGIGFGMAGPGQYFATDPVNTFIYGGTSPDGFMVQMKLDAGTYYLDDFAGAPFNSNLRSEMYAAGCGASDVTQLFGAVQIVPACKSLRDRLITDTHTSALRYNLVAGAVQFTDCPNQARVSDAFVVFGDTGSKWQQMLNGSLAFSQALPQGDDRHEDNRKLIQQMFTTSSAPGLNSGQTPWPSFGVLHEASATAWMLDNVLDCESGRVEKAAP